jgi:hypothetical protein
MSRSVVYDRGGALSTIDGILKDDYVRDQIRDAVNKSTFLLDKLTKKETTHGRQFIFPVEFGTSQGVGARGENSDLPNPGFGVFRQALGNVKYLYSTFYITGPAIAATAGNKAAFKSALETALKQAKEGMKLDIQRQVWGSGTGAIAAVQSNATAQVNIAVTNPYGLTYVAADLDNSQKTRLFKVNMRIWFSNANLFRTVTAVNSDGTITVDSAVTVTTADVIYRGDAAGNLSQNLEITGMGGLVSATGTYLNIARAGFREWQGNLIQIGSGSGGNLTEEAMRIAMDTAEINGTAGPEVIITDHKTRRRYEKLLQSQKRYTQPTKLEGGHSVLDFDGIPLAVDKDAPPQRMWFLRLSDICWMTMPGAEMDWMDEDGAVLKKVQGRDAYEAVLYTYRELITEAPANQTVLFDITGS